MSMVFIVSDRRSATPEVYVVGMLESKGRTCDISILESIYLSNKLSENK